MEGFLTPRQRPTFRAQRSKQTMRYGFLGLIGVLQVNLLLCCCCFELIC